MHCLLRIIYIVTLAAVAAVAPCRAQSSDHDFELARQMDVFTNILSRVDLHYVDTVNPRRVVEAGISHMLSELDPYTVYYPEERHDEILNFASGRYAGIGVSLRSMRSQRRCMLTAVEHGGPAEIGGLRPGDILLRVGARELGEAASDSPEDLAAYALEVAAALRGEPGSTIDIIVQRPGQTRPRAYTVRRRLIEQKSVTYAAMVSDSVGYICLMRFNENTGSELRQATATLLQRGAYGIVIDLRGNPGGLLSAAVDAVALFIPKETEVVRTRGNEHLRNEVYYTNSDPIDERVPLVVLTDGESASAAEITAGALQDYDRAVIVGRRTFGKGLVQSTYDLPYGGLLKITTARYYIPSGRCIQAVDYSHHNADGTHTARPDSLSRPFQTSAGRTVYEGGGIKPDIETEGDTISGIVVRIAESDVLYEFATEYVRTHQMPESPFAFHISEEDFAAFKQAVSGSNIDYGTRSREALSALRNAIRAEGYDSDVASQLDALEARLSPDLGLVMERWRKPIKHLLEQTIAEIAYGEAGLAEYNLRDDRPLAIAMALLRDGRRYRSILTTAPER